MNNIIFNKALFNPLFWKLRETTTRNIISYGGAGSSKSYSQAQHEVIRGIERKEKILIIRKVGNTIKDSTRPLVLEQIIPSFKLSEHFIINKSENILHCLLNGSQWLFRGLDDSEKIKSIAGITRIWIEEASELTEEDFDQLNLRLRGRDDLQITMTFNPIVETHWIKKRFFDKEQPNTTIFKTTYLDNRFIDKEYKKQLDSYKIINPNKYQVYSLGNWGKMDIQSPFAHQFDRSKHTSTEAVYDPNKLVYLSIDFNIDPFSAILFHIWRDQAGEHCHIFDEIEIPGGSIQKMADVIRTRYRRHLPSLIITGDAMGNKRSIEQNDNAGLYLQLVRHLGISARQIKVPGNPKHKTSREDVNYFLFHYPDFKINPVKCPNTVRDCETVEVDMYGKIKKSDRSQEAQKADFLDDVRYMVNTFFKGWIENHQKN